METVTCEVDGAPVPRDRVHPRVMNFGQAWRTPGLIEARYRARIPLSFVASHLDAHVCVDLIADFSALPDDYDEPYHELARRGWPAGVAIVQDAQLLSRLLPHLVDLSLLLFVFPAYHPHEDVVLNTIASAALDGRAVVVEGACRRPAQSYLHQDR